jgi:hypothetical protein
MGLISGRQRAGARRVAAALALLAALACVPGGAPAQERKPLLMEGKKTLYQRVLTRPGTKVVKEPLPDAAVVNADVTPFTVYYVYGRKRIPGGAMVEVGATLENGPIGWIDAKQAIEWKQALTVAFTNPADRKRVLLFRDRPALAGLIDAADPAKAYGEIYEAILANKPPANSPVVSIEPPEHVDIQQQFYLLPILEHQQALFRKGQPTTQLKIASVSLNDPPPPDAKKDDAKDGNLGIGFKTGIVFVVDTTITMGPYIDRMRDVIARVYKRVEAEKLEGDVSFGLVAYRNSVKSVPALEYTTKVFASLKDGVAGQRFLDLTAQVVPAKVSSGPQLPEDAYAGVVTALTEMDWEQYAARIIVLVSDASALEGNHPLASTGMFTAEIREFVQSMGIALFAVHLKTKEGARDHQAAATQYEMLTRFQGKDNLYVPVEAGSVDKFGQTIERLANLLVAQVRAARKAMDDPAKASPAPAPEPTKDPDIAGIDRKAALVGNAMQLAYLGRRKGTQAPPVFEAWLSDRDFDRPTLATLDVRLLLTRDQISDLQQVLKAVIKAGEAAQISPENFFADLQSAAAALARAPKGVAGATKSAGGAKNLAETGLIGEYLEGLPYKSEVLTMSQDLWLSWSIGEQQAFIDRLKSKIRLYEEFHNNVDNWVALDGGSLSGESVYPVPLEALP